MAHFLNDTEDQLEDWEEGAFVAPLMVVAHLYGMRRATKPLLLLGWMIKLYYHPPPYHANHSVIWLIYAPLALLGAGETLLTLAGIAYFAAGFHKLNSDFLHPVDGCGAEFISRLLREMSGLGNHNAGKDEDLEVPLAAKLLPKEVIVYGGIGVLVLELVPGLIMLLGCC